MDTGKVFLGILAGVAVGAMLGVLFAPEKGSDLRKKISKKGEDYAEGMKDKFDDFIESFSDKFDEAKEEVKEKI